MIRTVIYIAVVAALVAGAVWVADQPGGITLDWLGYRIQTDNVGLLLILTLAISVVAALIYRFWLGVRAVPRRIASTRKTSKQQKGYKALTQGMVAVAAGDATEAQRQAKRADKLLGDPPLTMLLSAQAAQLNGDEGAAKKYFNAMLENPETAFLGLRGLLMQAQREGDQKAALGYARRAHDLRPKTPWVLTTLFDLQTGEKRWPQALATLDDAIAQNAVSAADGRRWKLAVLLGCSAAAEDAKSALSHAKKAHQLAPEFLPAILVLARLMVDAGKTRPAARLIQNAWSREPLPELAAIYAEIGGDERALKKVRRIEKLMALNPEHEESRVAVAEAALGAELWGVARGHLEKAAGDAPSARVCRLMAELEEGEHGDIAAARSWLLRAATADPDPAWVCDDCGAIWAAWTPSCGKCAALGTLGWGPPQRAPMLPSRRGSSTELATPEAHKVPEKPGQNVVVADQSRAVAALPEGGGEPAEEPAPGLIGNARH